MDKLGIGTEEEHAHAQFQEIHAAAIDRSGRYVTVYPTGADLRALRSAAPAYVWDTLTNMFTATPLVEAISGGHDAYGFGYRPAA
jgi:hypothetical protein